MPTVSPRGVPALFRCVLMALAALQGAHSAQAQTGEDAGIEARYVGGARCVACHREQSGRWAGSHHDLAMQPATPQTVLGDFSNAEYARDGTITRFFRRGDDFVVNARDAGGERRDFRVTHTFGVYPLQQYLVDMPGGRLQALGVAWDARPAAEGGQRWFHLYPDDPPAPGERLHWTGRDQNWNYMCADCHSTALRKNYDADTDTYDTTFSEIDVSCEACHGPGSRHVARAEREPAGGGISADDGLAVHFDAREGVQWQMDPQRGIARRSRPLTRHTEVETCARCHARRSQLDDDYVPGERLTQSYMPALLEAELYHADGHIDEEVYVYGSFLQSRMYRAGVTCSDCHEPHSLALRAPGNAVCLQCHAAERFDTPAHHFHEAGTAGAGCAACHMPPKTYMVIDPRHDHSFRIPRPALSARLGTPDACTNCHAGRTQQWAAGVIEAHYGDADAGKAHFGVGLDAARARAPDALPRLVRIARDGALAGIVRGTALAELAAFPDRSSIETAAALLDHPDPLVRLGAVRALEPLPAPERGALAFGLLEDPVRAVRLEAARVLADVPAYELLPQQDVLLARVVREYLQAQRFSAERAESQVNIGNVLVRRGRLEEAGRAYRQAIDIDPQFVPAWINLADLMRVRNRDAESEAVLREGLALMPGAAALHHSLGLLLVRRDDRAEALKALAEAARLDPDAWRYGYVYAVALDAIVSTRRAIAEAERVHDRHPRNADVLRALVAWHRKAGNRAEAARYAAMLDIR